uniref:Fibronectin type-III domain-containing protein n=1 Tax=Oncorhynchus tshawytscha TaxID=74940 RepID=A0A8C8BUQ8_ONCTS
MSPLHLISTWAFTVCVIWTTAIGDQTPVFVTPNTLTASETNTPTTIQPSTDSSPTDISSPDGHISNSDEGDYDDESEEEEEVTEAEEGGKLIKENLCDFNPCLHLQRPCPEVREAKGQSCRCPGLTPTSVTPDPVVALEVWGVWPEAVRVRWCAPYSAVSKFGVWALRENGSVFSNGSVSAWSRQASVFGLKPGRRYGVCVSALNGAGTSHTRCVPVSTPVGVETVVLYVLTGLCVALGMTVVVMSVFLHRIWKMQNTHSLIEPRAQTLYNPRLTSLVSITNPAYTHTDEHTVPPSARYTQTDQLKLSTNVRNE